MVSSSITSTAGCRGVWLPKTAASKISDESIDWAERKPIGIRFNPSDEVLAGTFLRGKVFDRTDNPVFQFFKDINVYKHEPSELPGLAHAFGEGKMYFFTTIKEKYQNAARKYSEKTIFHREAPGGCWKKSGRISFIDVLDKDKLKLRVTKTSLAFYRKDEKSGKHEKTRWLMKEYMLDMQIYEKLKKPDPLVLCVVYYNNGDQDKEEGASSSFAPPTQNSNPDCQQDLGKRRCRRSNLPEISDNDNDNFIMLLKELPSILGEVMPREFKAKDMNISTNDQNSDLEQFGALGGSMEATLPTASVSAATNDMSQSLSEFYGLPAPHLQTEAPLQPPLSEGQIIQNFVAQDEENLFPGRPENAGYAESPWSIHEPAVVHPSYPIDLTESGMSDQNDNGFHPFGLPCSELEATQARPTNVPPRMGRAAPFSALADPALATKAWYDIYWENTLADTNLYQDPMDAQYLPRMEQEKNHFNLAEQPLSEQLQHQQLQKPNMFSPHARLNESFIEQVPCSPFDHHSFSWNLI